MRKDRLFRFVAFVATLGLVVGGLASCGTPVPVATPEVIKETVVVRETVVVTPEAKEPIRVGMGNAFTGPFAWVGEYYNRGITQAADEINAEGGILGHLVQISVCDTTGTPDGAIACVRKLVEQDNIDVLVTMGGSSPTLAVLPIVEEYEVPFVIGVASAAKVTEGTGTAGGNIWAFRITSHDTMMAEAFVDFVADEVDSICMLALNDDYGRGIVEKFAPLLEDAGTEILSEDYYAAAEPDYRPVITRMKSLEPEGVFLAMSARDASVFMRQFKELGMTAKVFSRGSMTGSEFLEAISDDPSIGEGVMEVAQNTTLSDPAFQERYLARWGKEPDNYVVGPYVALKDVVAAAVKAAIETTGEATRSSIRDALETISVDTTLLGHIEFDDYNQAHTPVYIMQIQNGEVAIAATVPTE